MAKGYGNLLLTEEGLETAHIPEAEREDAVVGFYAMKSLAERHHDRFYALASIYAHAFSYGSFYPNFYNLTWADFQSCKSLKGIGQRAYDLMQSFCQNPNTITLNDVIAFIGKDEPRAYTGYSNPKPFSVFVGDRAAWETWHREWYTAHPSEIDWSKAANDWLPRKDLTLEILKRELLSKIVEDGLMQEEARMIVSAIADGNVAHEFHDRVMKHKGDALEGYASQIGGEICRSNYYTYEAVLSDMERQYAKSLREVYSIVNKNGYRQFISIDFGHGMFEFHNEKGEHQGEYRFDGSFNSPIEFDHNLKCMDLWHKQTGK